MKRISTLILMTLIAGCSTDGEPGQTYKQLQVETSSGAVTAQIDDNVVSWQDIPYAQPPVGELRWRAPRPLQTPLGEISVRDAVACLQTASDVGGVPGDGVVGAFVEVNTHGAVLQVDLLVAVGAALAPL